MPKVEMIVRISGTRDGVDWPEIGESLVVPDQEAKDLIANGFARAFDPKAVRPEPEKATARKKPEARSGLTKASLG